MLSTGRAPDEETAKWDKTSEVPAVPGASRWWDHSKAEKPRCLKRSLARTGAIPKQGTVEAGTTASDASPEARAHKMSVGLTTVATTFMGDNYTFIDCPGSVEFIHDMRAALPAVDAAVVVCEADERKLPQLQLILRELEELDIPRFLFLNKIDKAEKRIRETLATLQPASRVPLVLRQIPIWRGELIEGFVDLALERAFVYREHAASEVIALDGDNRNREKEARFSMLEKLADHDDALMEQLLEDIEPPRDAVFDDLARELREGLICPVLLGVATRANGVLRLMKALRHEAPTVEKTAARLKVGDSKDGVAYVFKTLHVAHGGKASYVRVLVRPVRRRRDLAVGERRSRADFQHHAGQSRQRRQATDGERRRCRHLCKSRACGDRRHAGFRQGVADGAGTDQAARRRAGNRDRRDRSQG